MNILNIDTPEGAAEFEAQMDLNAELHAYTRCFLELMNETFDNFELTPATLHFFHERVAADYKEEIEPYTLQTGTNSVTGELYAVVGDKQ
jgi:hypothetical protein